VTTSPVAGAAAPSPVPDEQAAKPAIASAAALPVIKSLLEIIAFSIRDTMRLPPGTFLAYHANGGRGGCRI
jgi:hypothetical protein